MLKLFFFKFRTELRVKISYLTLGGGILDKDDGRGMPVPAGLGNPDEPEAPVRIMGGRSPERTVGLAMLLGADEAAGGRMLLS